MNLQQPHAFNQFQKFLSETKGDLHILEQRIPVELQMDYFSYSDKLKKTPIQLNESDIDKIATELEGGYSTIEHKKQLLSTLAISKQVSAYRLLEKYTKQPEEGLMEWAYMALMESRILLESELSEEKHIYISTGLGGKGQKLRFFVLLVNSTDTPFAAYQQQVIEKEFTYALQKKGCDVERLMVTEEYVELLLLMPIRMNIKECFENIIQECNQYGDFLSESFTVTNVKEFSEEEIAKVLESYDKNSSHPVE